MRAGTSVLKLYSLIPSCSHFQSFIACSVRKIRSREGLGDQVTCGVSGIDTHAGALGGGVPDCHNSPDVPGIIMNNEAALETLSPPE